MRSRALWTAVIFLCAIGVLAGVLRTMWVDDLVIRMEPWRKYAFDRLGLRDPNQALRAKQVLVFDERYSSHRFMTLLHVVPGALFLALAPLQFSKTLRRRHLTVHRWLGRALIVTALATAIPAFFFGLMMPFGGIGEAIAISLVGVYFAGSLIRGYLAIRRRETAKHREWMIRAFAAAIGISTIRVVAGIYDPWLAPKGFEPAPLFVLSLWTGWVITLSFAEWWIVTTRPRPIASAATS